MMMDYLFASYHIWRTQNSEGKNLLNAQVFNEFSRAEKGSLFNIYQSDFGQFGE